MLIIEQQLKEKNLKVTPQRVILLNEIMGCGHISIEDIYENIKKRYPSISLATVYKNVATLCESGILKEVNFPNQKCRYELNMGSHAHVFCEKCGMIEDVEIDLSSLSCPKGDFKTKNLCLTFVGVCSNCS